MVIALVIVAVAPNIVRLLGPGPHPQPTLSAIKSIRSLDITAKIHLLTDYYGYATYLPRNFSGLPSYYKDIPFDDFRRKYDINMILVDNFLTNDSRFRNDEEWKTFLQNYECVGFVRLLLPDDKGVENPHALYVDKSILPTNSQQEHEGTVAGANLMSDSGFEELTAMHDCFINGTRTADQAHTGTYSWKMTQQQWYPSLGFVGKYADRNDASRALRVRPGDKYYIEAWIYPKSTNVGTGSLSMTLTVRDSTGKQPEAYPHGYSGMPARGQWTKIGATVTVPDGYDLGWAGITVMTDVPMGDAFYIDDVMVVREQEN